MITKAMNKTQNISISPVIDDFCLLHVFRSGGQRFQRLLTYCSQILLLRNMIPVLKISALPMAYLVEKQGCRRATIFFSILAAASYLASVFIDSLYVLYFTIGGLAGQYQCPKCLWCDISSW